jgi:hypothetical protein
MRTWTCEICNKLLNGNDEALLFKEQLNLEAKIGWFKSWSRKYWKKLVNQINTKNGREWFFWKSRMLLLKFSLFAKYSNGNIINIFIYISTWFPFFSN